MAAPTPPPTREYESGPAINDAVQPLDWHGLRAYANANTFLDAVTSIHHVTDKGPQHG